MTLGSAVIWAAAVLAAVSLVSASGWARGRPSWGKTFRWAYGGMTAALLLAAVLLMAAILTHDYRYEYVVGYSSTDLPTLYLVSAFWGGQEGTYLLWALAGALLGYALFRKGSWQPAAVMTAYTPTVAILIAFMLNRGGNPFRLAPMTPADGRGLNPLLQDPWMAAHPPIVFLGYAAMTVPAVLAWVAALRRDEKNWLAPALRWSLIGFVTLGIGIIMGGIWAYKVLGWGGFWGWDPVENASLIPWIVGAALIHGLLVQQSTGALRRTNLVLAMAGYILVIYSTFLTRSGVLADFSVHSFPKGTIYGWLVAALIMAITISLYALFRRRVPEGSAMETKLAWPVVLTTAIVLLSVSAVMVLVGTSWPLLSSMAGKPSTPTAPFYNQVNLPVYVVLLGLLGLAPFLAWIPLSPRLWLRRFVPSVLLAGIGTILAAALGGRGLGPLVLFFVALLALASNLIRLVEVARRRFLLAGAAIAHTGFALIFVGIVAAESWDRSEQIRLPLGRPVPALGRVLTYQGLVEGSEPRNLWRIGVGSASGEESSALVTLYNLPDGQIFKKPSVLRGMTRDLYLAPSAIEGPESSGAPLELAKNEPVSYGGASLTFQKFEMAGGSMGGGMLVKGIVLVKKYGQEETIELPLEAGGRELQGTPVAVAALDGAILTMTGMSVEQGLIEVEVREKGGAASPSEAAPETMVLEASIKPLIGVLWLGTCLIALGSILAIVRRSIERGK